MYGPRGIEAQVPLGDLRARGGRTKIAGIYLPAQYANALPMIPHETAATSRPRKARVARRAAFLLAGLLVGGCGQSPVAPTAYSLTVLVRNEQQTPVAGAQVRISDGLNAGRTATSDATGNATLGNLQAGPFTLETSASGYQTVTQPVSLTASQALNVTMRFAPNTPPVVAVVVKSSYPNAPAGYVDLTESALLTASVVDPDSTPDKLSYEWTATSGTFTGTGMSVQWKPGSAGTATLTLLVIERYGPSNLLENRVTTTARVTVHDGKKESGDLTTLFLTEFSNSSLAAETVVRNFSSTYCAPGRAEELQQIIVNRNQLVITSSTISPPSARLNFAGVCDGFKAPTSGDACVTHSCEWISRYRSSGAVDHVKGTCQLTTVFDSAQDSWKLCWSLFDGVQVPSGLPSKWRF
jgi:hypothetical protein